MVTSQRAQPSGTLPNPFAASLLQGATTAARARIAVLEGGRDDLLTVRGVAARLGVSTATVYGLCKRGELAHVRVSNAVRVEAAELERFMGRARARAGERADRCTTRED
jgi:excisionase family DNA binding protein